MSERSEHLHALFQEIFDTPVGPAREALVEAVLREHPTVFTRMARQSITQFNIHPDWADDVRQIVRVEAWRYLSADLKPGFDARATLPCIRVAVRAEVQRMRQSSAYTGLSGAVTARRRESALAKHRMDLVRSLGYEPDDETLIASYNAKVAGSRSPERARNQGALATKEDLRLPRISDLDDSVDLPDTSDVSFAEVEVRQIVEEIVQRCFTEDEQVGQVAQVVLGGSLDDAPGEATWTASHVVQHVEMSSSQAARVMQRVRAVAVEVVDEWGMRTA